MPYAGTTLRLGGANHPWQEAITPLLADQEMDVSFVYWEGAIDVTGMMRGETVTGRGYAELTGYGEQSTAYQR